MCRAQPWPPPDPARARKSGEREQTERERGLDRHIRDTNSTLPGVKPGHDTAHSDARASTYAGDKIAAARSGGRGAFFDCARNVADFRYIVNWKNALAAKFVKSPLVTI